MKYPFRISWGTEILPVLIVAGAVVLGIYFYAHFPDKVAGHWNFAGVVDRYTGRAEGAFGMPILLVIMYLLFLVLPVIDPKKERYEEFERYYRVFETAILSALLVIYLAMGLFNLGYPVNIGNVVSGCVGLLFIILGNFMGKIKNNWFVGIKTPWTLSSENVWNKTHRMGGRLFIIYGLVIMATPYLSFHAAGAIFIAGAGLTVLGTMGYSYWLFKQEQK